MRLILAKAAHTLSERQEILEEFLTESPGKSLNKEYLFCVSSQVMAYPLRHIISNACNVFQSKYFKCVLLPIIYRLKFQTRFCGWPPMLFLNSISHTDILPLMIQRTSPSTARTSLNTNIPPSAKLISHTFLPTHAHKALFPRHQMVLHILMVMHIL